MPDQTFKDASGRTVTLPDRGTPYTDDDVQAKFDEKYGAAMPEGTTFAQKAYGWLAAKGLGLPTSNFEKAEQERVQQNVDEQVQGAKTLFKAVTDPIYHAVTGKTQLTPEQGQAVGQGLMNAPIQALQHPLKTAIGMTGANPDTLWNDVRDLNPGAVVGDLTVPAATALMQKVVGLTGGTIGKIAETMTPEARAARAATAGAEAATQSQQAWVSAMKKAIPKTQAVTYSTDDLNRALPYLAEQHGINEVGGVLDSVKAARNGL